MEQIPSNILYRLMPGQIEQKPSPLTPLSTGVLPSPSLGASEKKDEKEAVDREKKLVNQLKVYARTLEPNNEDFISTISLGLSFLQKIQTTSANTPIVEYWRNISKICFLSGGLPKGKIDKQIIERHRDSLKTFIDQNRDRVPTPVLTTFNASSTSSMASQSASADESEAIAADQNQKKCQSNASTGLFKTKMFWDPETNRPNQWDVPSKPVFTHTTSQFSELSQKSVIVTVKILDAGFWIDLEAKLMSALVWLVPGHTREDRENNIRIAASLISMVAYQTECDEKLSSSLHLISKYDPLHVNLYCILIEFLTIPENWKIIKNRVPLLTNDCIGVSLINFGNSFRDGYMDELHTTLSECLNKEQDEEKQFRRLDIAVDLVMIARYFAVVATCHKDVVFERYKNQIKDRNSKDFSLYPDMANVIEKHWRALTPWLFSGLSQPSMVNLMTFFGAMASYTTPSRAASAMEQCRNESCAFCSDYRILSPPKPTSMPAPSAACQ